MKIVIYEIYPISVIILENILISNFSFSKNQIFDIEKKLFIRKSSDENSMNVKKIFKFKLLKMMNPFVS